MNEHLRLGYDIGKGFLTGEEDMMQQFERLALMDEEQTQELKQHSDNTRIEVIKSLGEQPSMIDCSRVTSEGSNCNLLLALCSIHIAS